MAISKLELIKKAIEWARTNPEAYARFVDERRAEEEAEAAAAAAESGAMGDGEAEGADGDKGEQSQSKPDSVADKPEQPAERKISVSPDTAVAEGAEEPKGAEGGESPKPDAAEAVAEQPKEQTAEATAQGTEQKTETPPPPAKEEQTQTPPPAVAETQPSEPAPEPPKQQEDSGLEMDDPQDGEADAAKADAETDNAKGENAGAVAEEPADGVYPMPEAEETEGDATLHEMP